MEGGTQDQLKFQGDQNSILDGSGRMITGENVKQMDLKFK